MYQKITAQNVGKIKKGDILVMYPVSPEIADDVDVKDIYNNAVVLVTNIIGNTFGLQLKGSIIPASLNAGTGPIRRERCIMVEEKNWWLYRPEISN